jgi:inosine/xanthosine triphosphate pyrophosphatase family protein
VKITLVTLYDGAQSDHFVGAVSGSLSNEQRKELAIAYDALLDVPEDEEDEEPRYLTFVELDTVEAPHQLGALRNIDDSYPTVSHKP